MPPDVASLPGMLIQQTLSDFGLSMWSQRDDAGIAGRENCLLRCIGGCRSRRVRTGEAADSDATASAAVANRRRADDHRIPAGRTDLAVAAAVAAADSEHRLAECLAGI